MLTICGIDHVVLRVTDIERMRKFYCDVLGAQHVAWRPALGMSHLRVGAAMIDLVKGERSGCNMDHLCLRVEPFDQRAILGNGVSIYLTDPEGNTVELKGPSDGQPQP
jgi:glyoxylase I family protein